jgi:hypothetical protein
MIEKLFVSILALVAFSLSTSFAQTTESLTYNPSDDAFVRGGASESNNYGTDLNLVVKTGTVSDFFRKSLLKFDLSNQDLNAAEVDKVTLKLYANKASACSITAFELDDNWTESDVSWGSCPLSGNNIISAQISSSGIYYEWDVTSYVLAQISNDRIISFCLEDKGADNVVVNFNSKENGSNLPELVINTNSEVTQPPAAPTSLNANAISSSVISLQWTDNANNETAYRLERKEGNGSYSEIAVLSRNVTSYNDGGLTASTTYTYRVFTLNDLGNSDYSNEASATTMIQQATSDYYIEAVNGNDDNNGQSETTAWKTLSKVNATTFLSSDRILFKAGDVWTGRLYPKGSGTDGKPIIIDMYGSGNKPIIDGNGMTGTGVVYLYNQEYWEINNLEITNDAASAGDRRGVRIEVANYGTADHIHLKNLYVHNIKGSIGQSRADKRTAGIGFGIVSVSTKATHFNDILIENCIIHSCQNEGIITECVKKDGYEPGTPQWEERKITNAVIRNNTIYDISKNAMVLRLFDGGVVENNVCYNTANGITGNTIYTCACDGTVFQYNEGYENHSPDADGSMYDADLRSPRTIWQYSYSHNNAHGLFWACTVQNDADIICRYNISQNDKGIIFCMNYPVTSIYNYNNTVYVGAGRSPQIISERKKGGNGTRTYTFENNLIYNEGSATYHFRTSSYKRTIDNNCFYGNHHSSEPVDKNKVTADPKLVAPGTGGIGLNTVDGYQLQQSSPCIDAGKTIANNGGVDYWGNLLSDGAIDIGAHEYTGTKLTGIERVSGNEEVGQSVKAYPNPLNQNLLSIDLAGFEDLEDIDITITNLQGQTVYKNNIQNSNNISINTNGLLNNSIYFVTVKSGKTVTTTKLIVQ